MSGPLDDFGYPAYSCAVDGRELEPVADTYDVLRCPKCGHRSDEPGDGVLGDAFDVIHRQWGRRGDTHAWRALRDSVALTPTPPDEAAVREAFVDGLREVADVDIDEAGERYVYRRHLDHGGMSGGGLDTEWWRTKGLPLLVDRAIARRPPQQDPPKPSDAMGTAGGRRDRSWRSTLGTALVWAVVLAIPVATVGGGGWLLYERGVGTRVEATVLECDHRGNFRRYGSTIRTECIAEWTIGGRTVIGGFHGGNGSSDVGRTVSATVRGDSAYSRSLGLPILLIALGSPFLLIPAITIRDRRRRGGQGHGAPTTSI
jgi:hypothetical protein